MAQTYESSDADVMKLLEKLTEKITRHVHGLHVLREAVTLEEQRQRSEEINLRDREKEVAETEAKRKRTRSDEAVNIQQYGIKLESTKTELSASREAALKAEMNQKLLAAVRDLVTKKEMELGELRRNRQWTSQAEGGSTVNTAIKHQISVDLEQMTKRVGNAKKDLAEVAEKKAEASQLINKVRAYIATERNAKLDMECRVKAMSVEYRKQKEMAAVSRPKHIRLRQVTPSLKEASRLAILKELQEERVRGGKLSKDLSDLTQLALEKAAKRKEWLEKNFPKNDDVTVIDESAT